MNDATPRGAMTEATPPYSAPELAPKNALPQCQVAPGLSVSVTPSEHYPVQIISGPGWNITESTPVTTECAALDRELRGGTPKMSEDLDARLEAGDLFEQIARMPGKASVLAKRWLEKWT